MDKKKNLNSHIQERSQINYFGRANLSICLAKAGRVTTKPIIWVGPWPLWLFLGYTIAHRYI